MTTKSNVLRLPRLTSNLTWNECRLLFESVTDYAIFLLDPEGRVATWTPGAHRIKGYAADEIVGESFERFYTPEDLAAGKPARALETAEREGRFEDEGWRVRKDGTRFWANVVMTAMRDENGSLHGFAKVTRDLTKRRALDDELHRSEQRFHHLVDAVTDYAIFLLDERGCVETWNVGAYKTKGYEESEIVGRHFSTFYTPEDRANGKPERLLEIARREGRVEDEGWRVRKDGTRFWANVIITVRRDERGRVVGYAKVTRDLTERRAGEETLRRSEERFHRVIDAITDYAIFMLDVSGNVETWNSGAKALKGYEESEIDGRNFSAFYTPEDRAAGMPEKVLETVRREGRFEDERWRVRKDGTRFWAHVVITALRDANGTITGFAKVTKDLTDRRAAEQVERELVRAQAERSAAEAVARRAEEANRIKDEFLATVSHELRTPLNAIVGWAALLRQQKLEPTTARAVEVIDRNAKAQVKIVEDILDMSRIVNGKLRIDPRPTDIVAVARDTVEVVRPSAEAKQLVLMLEYPDDVVLLSADPDRVQQVLWNLLSNAVKFTEPKGSVLVKIVRHGTNVHLSVTDTGRGIEPEFLPYVFDRFKQADSSTTRRFGGLGLGLSLVKHIVELHGGSVRAQSAGPGTGATFTVVLPVRAVQQHVEPEPEAPAPPAAASLPRGDLRGVRVVVVDDEPDARQLIATMLTNAGAEVEVAGSAREALEAVRKHRPDMVVSDIGMPDEDGYALVRELRALSPEEGGGIPTIALTAYTRTEDRNRALAAGFTTHIGKPVSPADLVNAVMNLARLVRR